MKKGTTIALLCALVLITLNLFVSKNLKKEPIIITEHGLLEKKTINDFIAEAELILIGTVNTVFSSRWDTVSGDIPPEWTLEDIYEADAGIFTDTSISIDQLLKGNFGNSIVRVRSFHGEVGNVQWLSDVEPAFTEGSSYVLFLVQDDGPTAGVDPGDYISVNAVDAIYIITDGIATSPTDEWVLEDLIAYIQTALQNGQ